MRSAYDLLTRWPALDVAARRDRLRDGFQLFAGPLQQAVASHAAAAAHAVVGLWRRDPAVWSAEEAVQRTISNRLGWLSSPALMAEAIPRLQAFAASVRADGFTDVVLLGMGGSSLAPEVLRAVLGVGAGSPRFHMLDSTDPAAVAAVVVPPDRTLFVLASKSGTTIEPNALAAHFKSLVEARVPEWNRQFIAITDEGTELARRAERERFREVFINPSDIGGRYSALSYFGLVPAALMGQDLNALIGWGLAMLSTCDPDEAAGTNPAAALGQAMGAAALAGRDKLTLVLPRALEPFGLWVEQLVAESTGKQGKGIVPIAGEPFGRARDYGADRFFVHLRPQAAAAESDETDSLELRASSMPFAEIALPEAPALGAEFVRWEIATAVAGALLGVNPFDEPNVKQAKDATSALLGTYTATGSLPADPPDRSLDGLTMTLTSTARRALGGRAPDAFLSLLEEGDYFGVLAFLGPDPALHEQLLALRIAVRSRARVATMFGYGPRYLHSTGQLHKGGPNSGVFVLITANPERDRAIPGQPFSFGTLELAQALGDFTSLDAAGRRALHVHLDDPDARRLSDLTPALLAGLSNNSGTT